MTTKLFDVAREIAGGKLTQKQVDKLNEFLATISQSKRTSTKGRDLIKTFEGLRLKAYDDGVGVWTIGYGTTIYPNGVKVKRGDVITEAQAEVYLQHDLKRFEDAVNRSVLVPLNQNQFDALVSLVYNIGIGAFEKSTLLRKLNGGHYIDAANQFDVWRMAGGKVMQGLVNRRAKEKVLFLS